MQNSSLPSLDLTGLQEVPFAEVRGDFEALVADPRRERVDALDGLLIGRALWLLKVGTRAQALDEALQLARLLSSKVGEVLRGLDPVIHGAWHGYCELLTEGARRSDPVFTDTLLRGTSGHGEKILSILVAADGPVQRALLRKRVGISDSNFSHLLRTLEEGDLILRRRVGRTVEIELGPEGREIAEERFRPSWVEHLVELLHSPKALNNSQQVASELRVLGAPSDWVASQLATAICSRDTAASPSNSDRRVVAAAEAKDDDDRLRNLSPEKPLSQAWSNTAKAA